MTQLERLLAGAARIADGSAGFRTEGPHWRNLPPYWCVAGADLAALAVVADWLVDHGRPNHAAAARAICGRERLDFHSGYAIHGSNPDDLEGDSGYFADASEERTHGRVVSVRYGLSCPQGRLLWGVALGPIPIRHTRKLERRDRRLTPIIQWYAVVHLCGCSAKDIIVALTAAA